MRGKKGADHRPTQILGDRLDCGGRSVALGTLKKRQNKKWLTIPPRGIGASATRGNLTSLEARKKLTNSTWKATDLNRRSVLGVMKPGQTASRGGEQYMKRLCSTGARDDIPRGGLKIFRGEKKGWRKTMGGERSQYKVRRFPLALILSRGEKR